jgi:MYXO-CTERM domain-containing protein
MIMRATRLFLAATLAIAPVQVMAQSNDTGEVDVTKQHDNGNSRLGLLGLLGLGGLLGLMRREPDIHVDARRDKRG